MKKFTILSAAAIAGLFLSASAQAQIIINGGTAYGGPIDVTPVATGLYDTVIHVGYNSSEPVYHGYNEYPTNLGIDDASITTIQNYAANYGPSSTGYANNNLNAPSYTFLNTNTGFQYTGGSNPTSNYLGADAAGAALTDNTPIPGTIFYATGYIDITDDLVGDSYTFTINSADDAGRVSIGGQTVIEDNYFGASSGLAFSNTADVTFTSAGLYAISVLTYQNGGGAGFSYTATPDFGSTAFTYQVAAAPEPSTWALMLGGVCALVVISRRRAVRA